MHVVSGGRFEQCARFRFYGAQLALVLAFFIAVTSMALVVKRASMEDEDEGHQPFAFILSYLIEMFLVQFCYFPVVFTIIFSGVLGCGVLPILGGRPREIMLMENGLESRELNFFSVEVLKV